MLSWAVVQKLSHNCGSIPLYSFNESVFCVSRYNLILMLPYHQIRSILATLVQIIPFNWDYHNKSTTNSLTSNTLFEPWTSTMHFLKNLCFFALSIGTFVAIGLKKILLRCDLDLILNFFALNQLLQKNTLFG